MGGSGAPQHLEPKRSGPAGSIERGADLVAVHGTTMPQVTEDRGAAWRDIRRAGADTSAGAAEIARRGAIAMAALPRTDLEEAATSLVAGHPSMAPLWRLASAVLSAENHADSAARFAQQLMAERDAVASVAAEVLTDPVVTHSFSSTLVDAVVAARVPALCARSDPGGEGSVTAERVRERGVEAEVVSDPEAIRAAANGRAVVTGADAIGPGGLVNKVGTGALAVAGARGGAGRYAVAGGSKLLAVDLPVPLPFERTPLGLFTGAITDEGVLTPDETVEAASAHPLHPALAELLARLR
jgi:translation initiation factor 2B subunit (eIF-2B alpha/beta/delta family)